jgi:patatin-related protein
MPHSQEVRFAVVLYGGVSLAIYINGVVQELLRLVRSTSGLAPRNPGNSETVYRKLGCLLERGSLPPVDANPATDDDIKTKFMVDIISGTSAGGLNGIYLAKALVGDKDIDSVQDLWFDQGDISELLNDSKSYKGIPVSQPKETESLLNSRRMYYRLLKAFDDMDSATDRRQPSPEGAHSLLADEIDVFATTTDIEGVPVPIRLLDNIVYERRHRNDFHLRFIPGERNDFQADNNPFLAFAARCTSSFPFAFEPMRLCDIDEILCNDPIYSRDKDYCRSNSARWQKFYTEYLELNPGAQDAVYAGSTGFPKRSFGDGGYLNNAPFSFAVDALLARQPVVPIDRKLIYVEPSPQHPEEEAPRAEKPDAIENSLAALVTIPGYQTILNDLERVLERNANAAKINKDLGEVFDPNTTELPDLAPGDLTEFRLQPEAPYRGYHKIRATDTTNLLALIVARTLSIDEQSILFVALRSLIRAWRDHDYREEHAGESGMERFLRRFDIAYRVRRLRFVLRKLDTLYALRLDIPDHPARRAAVVVRQLALGLDHAQAAAADRPPDDLPEVWDAIAAQYAQLHRIARRLTEKPLPSDAETPPAARFTPLAGDPVIAIRDLLLPMRQQVIAVLSQIAGIDGEAAPAEPEGGGYRLTTKPLNRSAVRSRLTELACDQEAENRLRNDADLHAALAELDAQLGERFAAAFEAAHAGAVAIFPAPDTERDAGRIAARFYQGFDLFDCVQFPMSFGTNIGEPDAVDIIRVCPEDAPALVPGVTARRSKLKGLVVAHFGAFLDRDWRVSDLLWGRLDAAERIITGLLPLTESTALRDRLIDEAQDAILREFRASDFFNRMTAARCTDPRPGAAPTAATAQAILNHIAGVPPGATRQAHRAFMDTWMTVVPSEPDRVALLRTLARGSQIVGRILDGIAAKKSLPLSGSWLVNAGRALWGIVEISIPRKIGTLFGRYWQSLLLLISIVLIAAGILGAQSGVAAVGWTLLLATLLLFLVRATLARFMRGGNVFGLISTVAAVAAALVFAAGGWQIYSWAAVLWDKLQHHSA